MDFDLCIGTSISNQAADQRAVFETLHAAWLPFPRSQVKPSPVSERSRLYGR
jgi:hypothetical protein